MRHNQHRSHSKGNNPQLGEPVSSDEKPIPKVQVVSLRSRACFQSPPLRCAGADRRRTSLTVPEHPHTSSRLYVTSTWTLVNSCHTAVTIQETPSEVKRTKYLYLFKVDAVFPLMSVILVVWSTDGIKERLHLKNKNILITQLWAKGLCFPREHIQMTTPYMQIVREMNKSMIYHTLQGSC